jgi:ABC-type antimicrobial peptide transport system permease subunit
VRASGIPVLRGRGFLPQDEGSANSVVLVNQAFVDKYLVGRNPLGVEVKMHRDPTDKDSDIPVLGNFTIVGVVQNEMQGSDLASDFQPMIYLNNLQLPKDSMFLQIYGMMSQFAIRSPLPQDVLNREIRAALKQTAPDMAEMQLQPMEEGIANSLAERRLALRLVSGFGAMALILAAIGIYGMLAYTVNTRRREIGVRMALGSSRTGVSRLILKQAGRMVAWALVPGIAGAWAAEHAVRSFLFGVKPLDPLALAASAAVLAVTAAVAAAVPAWRASRVDPMEVLRVD